MKKSALAFVLKTIHAVGDDRQRQVLGWRGDSIYAYLRQGVRGGALKQIPGAIDILRAGRDTNSKAYGAVRRETFDSVTRALRDIVARDVISICAAYDQRMDDVLREHPTPYSLPKGTPKERLEEEIKMQIARALRARNVRAYESVVERTGEKLGRYWTSKTQRFCTAAPNTTFVVDSEFKHLGADMAMIYELTTAPVSGRGYNRGVGGVSRVHQYGAVITIDDTEYIGVAKSQSAAIARARAAAGEAAATALNGDFEGGFL